MRKKNIRPQLIKRLIQNAKQARKNSLAAYTGIKVGAAILSKSGKIYKGCNIQSIMLSPSICAERSALFNAFSEGEKKFTHIAVLAFRKKFIMPCGTCRQILFEFSRNIQVISANLNGDYRILKLKDLLPCAPNLKKNMS